MNECDVDVLIVIGMITGFAIALAIGFIGGYGLKLLIDFILMILEGV